MAKKGKKNRGPPSATRLEHELEILDKKCQEARRNKQLAHRKKFTPFIQNNLEPYFHKDAPYLGSATTRKSPHRSMTKLPPRSTATDTVDPWKSLDLERERKLLPGIHTGPVVQAKQGDRTDRDVRVQPKNSCRFLAQLEELWGTEENEPKSPVTLPATPACKYLVQSSPTKDLHERTSPEHPRPMSDPITRDHLPPKPTHTNLVQSLGVTESARVSLERHRSTISPSKSSNTTCKSVSPSYNNRLPVFPTVSLPTPRLSKSGQLDHDDVPQIREQADKKHMKLNHLDKEIAHYLRTKHDIGKFSLDQIADKPKGKRSKLEKMICAYLTNTPGSCKAIRECLKGHGLHTDGSSNEKESSQKSPRDEEVVGGT